MIFSLSGSKCQVEGEIFLPGDKSITHRALFLSAISRGKTSIENYSTSEDCLTTVEVLKQLGVKFKYKSKREIIAFGKGLDGLNKPGKDIFIKESGTTFRLLLGILAGQFFLSKVCAGKSLSKRPMSRVTQPLRLMGACISSANRRLTSAVYHPAEEYPPITISSGGLKGIVYKMPVASAQVKSAILLAGLYASGLCKIVEPVKTRDHTERMLKLFKAGIKISGNNILLEGGRNLVSPEKIYIPGDISSASFFIVLASILPRSKLVIRNVGLNSTRCGMIKVLKRMGAEIKIKELRLKSKECEPVGDLIIKSSKLRGTLVTEKEIPSLIDELPVLMVAAAYANGKSIFRGVGELRVKETDRIRSMSENLRKMGADIEVHKSAKSIDIIIRGKGALKGAKVSSFNDHRTAMSLVVAGLHAEGRTVIDNISCISKSFPGFIAYIKKI
ncbi:MAG: 3-phosphoshikimate 1-carboxyvinyltransferase, partial [Candidatus Omnitrophica bacterium]|nr:3-phosphoshikimate 1-carboxyvinyltransferase [Candidatus Omnitrophota bacterium]